MSAVFSVYGIGVDYRHLTVIADYMVSCFRFSFRFQVLPINISFPLTDMRRWIQTFQPNRSLEQFFPLPQSFLRNYRQFRCRSSASRRLRQHGWTLSEDRRWSNTGKWYWCFRDQECGRSSGVRRRGGNLFVSHYRLICNFFFRLRLYQNS